MNSLSRRIVLLVCFVLALPFLPFDLVSYGAGLTSIKTWRFTVATLFGLIPASFLLAHFGGELNAAGLEQALRILLLLGAVTALPLIATAALRWYRQLKRVTDQVLSRRTCPGYQPQSGDPEQSMKILLAECGRFYLDTI